MILIFFLKKLLALEDIISFENNDYLFIFIPSVHRLLRLLEDGRVAGPGGSSR